MSGGRRSQGFARDDSELRPNREPVFIVRIAGRVCLECVVEVHLSESENSFQRCGYVDYGR